MNEPYFNTDQQEHRIPELLDPCPNPKHPHRLACPCNLYIWYSPIRDIAKLATTECDATGDSSCGHDVPVDLWVTYPNRT
jgi:hypothetical protein